MSVGLTYMNMTPAAQRFAGHNTSNILALT